MAVFLQRDTVLHITPNDGDGTAMSSPVVYRVPVLEGFSFSQTTNSTDVTLAEMESSAGTSRRGRRVFNDSLAPAEWSFSTYIRPFLSGGAGSGEHGAAVHHAVDEVLWNALLAKGHPLETTSGKEGAFSAQTASLYTMTAARSNRSSLNTMTMEFAVGGLTGGMTYVLTDAVVNGASITFDVDGIATVEWTGFAQTVTEKTANSGNPTTATIVEGQQSGDTNNFIRNRLTTLTLDGDNATNAASIADLYSVTLTGGTITIDNGITYLTPDTLGTVNTPLAHVTGPRNISGSFTCYLASGTNTSQDFFQDMTDATALADVTNVFDLSFAIGGASSPKATIDMDYCHIEVPSHAVDEVISIEANFHSLPSDLDSADDFSVTFVGPAVT